MPLRLLWKMAVVAGCGIALGAARVDAQAAGETATGKQVPVWRISDAIEVTATPEMEPEHETRTDLMTEAAPKAVLPLTLEEKARYAAHLNLGPPALVVPAFPTMFILASPPKGYPKSWRSGPEAAARVYGAELVGNTAMGAAGFLTGALTHEDPRYFPAQGRGVGGRLAYALAFTLVDRNDRGKRCFAWSNLAAAVGGGFAYMGLQPMEGDNVAHGLQFSAINLAALAGRNLFTEFGPALARLVHKRVSNDPETAAQTRAEHWPAWWRAVAKSK